MISFDDIGVVVLGLVFTMIVLQSLPTQMAACEAFIGVMPANMTLQTLQTSREDLQRAQTQRPQ